jgi:signal transduction histidine kinase/CheY-like chemotaxis protein
MKNAVKQSETTMLRKKAEALLKKKALKTISQLSEIQLLKLIHELEVHQIELELQNEELMLSKMHVTENASDKYAELYDFAPSGYFTLSPKGEIIELNLCGAQMLGQIRSRLKNIRLDFFISDDTKKAFNIFLEKVFCSKIRESCEVTLSIKGLLPIYAHLTGIVNDKREYCLITVADITERKLMENELIKAKEKAEESDRLKTAFLQNISHEIRSPMNAIMGFSKLLVTLYNNKAKLDYYSTLINQRCVDLLDIINEILDIAKIESGLVTVHPEECKLNSMFSELFLHFTEAQKRLNKQHIKFNIQDCGQSGSVIIIDKAILKQIFTNLIGNALKFTEKGRIQAGCKFDENHNLVFYVSDTGIGIPADKHNKIFEHFTQLDYGITRLYGGAGLGLSIVKGLLNLLDGEIWLESEPGKGSTFYFTFSSKKTESSQREPEFEKHTEYRFSNKTILIVEDDLYNAKYFKEILAGTGSDLLNATYGKEAVKIALAQPVDLVIMDIRLPDIDGYEAIREIRQYKPDLKIIAQTAYVSYYERQKAFDSGCNDYVCKPAKKELWLSVINKQLSKSIST